METLGSELINALGGPRKCKNITIEIPAGGHPMITFQCIASGENADKIREVIYRYRLKRRRVKVIPA